MPRIFSSTRFGPARRRLRELVPFLLAGLLPTAIAFAANARFILSHFYARAPFLLDAGWHSALVHRAGVSLVNPGVACDYARTFYGLHISPILALFSALSYVVPLERIEWYATFQGMVYAPFGLAVYLVASRSEPVRLRRWLLTALAALAFAFNGPVLSCVGFPHFEAAIAALLCLMLACVATNRMRLASLFLILTLSIREDAGLHAGLALLPLVYLQARGVLKWPSRRALLALVGTAFGASVAAIVLQKSVFSTSGLFRAEYLGDPPLAHLTLQRVAERLSALATERSCVTIPFAFSLLVAALRRDPRYLLGWLATAPWFLLNLLAYQAEKASFSAYTVFPFIVSFFWVFLYGTLVAPQPRRLPRWQLEGLLTVASVLSVLGMHSSDTRSVITGMLETEPQDRKSVRAFVQIVRDRRPELGRLAVDEPISALAIETIVLHDALRRTPDPETFLLHRESAVLDANVLVDLDRYAIPSCLLVEGTGLVTCTRSATAAEAFRTLRGTPMPAGLALTSFLDVGRDVRFAAERVTIGASSKTGLIALARNLWIHPGNYELSCDVFLEEMDLKQVDAATVEAVLDGALAGRAHASTSQARHHLVLPLTIARDTPFSWRLFFNGGARVVIERVALRALPPPVER